MLTKEELLELLGTTETVRLEKTVSTDDRDKFCAAICAFANDMPGEGRNGYLLIGVHDDGSLSGLRATDRILKDISSLRNDGNILPLPVMNVGYVSFDDGDVIVVEVTPSILPPVRYRGRTWIRVGPRKGIATIEEENILIERRRSKFPTFDTMPCPHAKLEDLDLDLFRHEYLPKAFDEKTIAADTRSVDRQLEALNFYSTEYGCPTYAGLILFGRDPRRFMPGNYIQYVEFSGPDRASDPVNQHEFAGPLDRMLAEIDVFVKTSIAKNKPVPVSALREKNEFVYPVWSIRELVMNAIMHRDYQSTGPTKFYQFPDRLEITNSGGLYGRVNAANFPDENDYRNPIVAEAIKVLGYVNRFGRGIGRVQSELASNGNALAAFHPDIGTFKVIVPSTLYGAESILTTEQSIPFAAESIPLSRDCLTVLCIKNWEVPYL